MLEITETNPRANPAAIFARGRDELARARYYKYRVCPRLTRTSLISREKIAIITEISR